MSESGLELHVGRSEARGRWRPTQKRAGRWRRGGGSLRTSAQHLIQQDMWIPIVSVNVIQPVSINPVFLKSSLNQVFVTSRSPIHTESVSKPKPFWICSKKQQQQLYIIEEKHFIIEGKKLWHHYTKLWTVWTKLKGMPSTACTSCSQAPSVQLLSCVLLFVTSWTAARQASLSIPSSI